MKTYKVLVVLTMFLGLFLYGCTPSYQTDSKSGILIKNDSPENAVTTFYELQSLGSYEAAYKVLEKKTQESLTPNELQYYWESGNLQAKMAKVLTVKSKGDFSTVVFVRFKTDTNSAMIGSEVLKKVQGRWYVFRDTSELNPKQTLQIYKLLINAEDATLGADLKGFSAEHKASIKDQVFYWKSKHKESYALMEDYIKNPEKYEKDKESVSEEAYDNED